MYTTVRDSPDLDFKSNFLGSFFFPSVDPHCSFVFCFTNLFLFSPFSLDSFVSLFFGGTDTQTFLFS